MNEPKAHTLDVPGAELHYDIRSAESLDAPALLLIGSPMDATGFTTLAGHFQDRTVVTYDPRGAGRSTRTDGATQNTPDEHADDLHRLLGALDAGPVDVFASSGGAVNALALVAAHPEQVRLLVAHEPPAAQVVPDREQALAAVVDVHRTYVRAGFGAGMAKFIALSSIRGPVPAGFPEQPADPVAYGLPTADDGSRNDPLLGQNMIGATHYQPDFDALRAVSAQIVLAVGAESVGILVYRAAQAVAERLGSTAVTFPGDHGGFLGGEYGMTGEPDAFAAKLREVLAGR
ncbi:alpha/beta fold hydrolase [Nonomuraea sp. NPDC050663]|uniref:alpha/beta fold hydrolase n=1 Tax=Nonomuraea sp. NPDC050663 TaxID=3364370 RepID=UPI0037A1C0E4